MKKWSKRIAIVLAALFALAAAGLVAGMQLAEQKMRRKVDVRVTAVQPRSDAQAMAQGRYLYVSRGCIDCHGADGAGRTFIDDGHMRVAGANITPAPGSAVDTYTNQDWVRAIRHGVSARGRALMIMPSQDYNRLTDDDLAALLGYIQNLPPVSGGGKVFDMPAPVLALYGFGMIQDAASKIDHTLPPEKPVPAGVNLAHGAYVANICLSCHGDRLKGGKIPGAPPDWPSAANLTPGAGTAMTAYTDANAFIRLFKTGQRPDGTPVKVMPFDSLREISETDMRALYLYLKSLPPQPHG
jgi:mono/diheme cytochrome c family protein